jgi:DNA ligase 1
LLQVVLFCFDCLYLNGKVMMREPLHARRQAMYDSIAPQEGKIQFATAKTSRDIEELQQFLDEAVDACTEGLIVKTLADTYEPSKRSLNWLKLKKDYLEGCGDTFDVVVIGALHGKGKRTGAHEAMLL